MQAVLQSVFSLSQLDDIIDRAVELYGSAFPSALYKLHTAYAATRLETGYVDAQARNRKLQRCFDEFTALFRRETKLVGKNADAALCLA